MSDSRWQHMQWLFHEAMRQPEDQRVEWLKAACAEDAALFQEVDTLLRASGASVEVLEPRTPHPDQGNARAGEGLPDRIGPYRIIRRIGQGGMGSVYEAEEDRPRRRVALKVMRGGVISADAKKRFEHEAQMLARLHHPGIAKIFGAGTVQHRGEDIEYIAMDLIDGSPLTVFAHTRKLPHRERLELLARVCDAVQHAHQRGVIHRDLKPSNILVSADGQPTVVDFGIARATDADVRLTRTSPGPGPLLGTVPYMSPEQAAGDVAAIDTRSDVYSLGVIGYELLSGRPSVDPENRPLPELLRAIREDDPAPLSTFDRSLRGDVETIIATALDKTPERRYQSAGALAADIRRHLNDQSILARPVSRAELIVRFTRRHRALVAGAGIAVTALVAATIVTTVLAVQKAAALRDTTKARDRAVDSGTIASETMRWFSEELITSIDPRRNQKPDISFREVLDVASSRVGGFGFTRPESRLNAEYAFAEAYRELGELEKALAHAREAARVAKEGRLAEVEVLTTSLNVARVLNLLGRHEEALVELEPLLPAFHRLGPSENANHVKMAMSDAHAALGRLDEATRLLQEALPSQEKLAGDRHPDTQKYRTKLANYYIKQSKYDEARPLLEKALTINRELHGETGQDTLNTMNWLAALHRDSGKLTEAEALQRQVLEAIRKTTPEGHWIIGAVEANLGHTLLLAERLEESVQHLRAGVGIMEKALGHDHPHTKTTAARLIQALEKIGDAEGVRALRERYPG